MDFVQSAIVLQLPDGPDKDKAEIDIDFSRYVMSEVRRHISDFFFRELDRFHQKVNNKTYAELSDEEKSQGALPGIFDELTYSWKGEPVLAIEQPITSETHGIIILCSKYYESVDSEIN